MTRFYALVAATTVLAPFAYALLNQTAQFWA